MVDRAKRFANIFALPILMAMLAVTARAEDDISLDQGWTQRDLTAWYEMSAGSRLIPLSWLLALEQPDNDQKFLEDAHINKFRYLPHVNSDGLPLPLGFAVDAQSDTNLKATKLRWKSPQSDTEAWVGMNCSACHTADIAFKGKRIRVQGGPTLADFESFMASLDRALTATRDEPNKWNRFAARVLGDADTEDNRATLKNALGQFIERRLRIESVNATPLHSGYGRLDAFDHIFNDIAFADGAPNPKPLPADAPVSYPFLWNVPQHDKVQWNGIAPNAPFTINGVTIDPGALVRNTSGMIGVFAEVNVTSDSPLKGYASSLPAANIVAFEDKLRSLLPPRWPAELFGAPDPALVEKGHQLFAAHCAKCHEPLERTDLRTRFKVKMARFAGAGEDGVGTDPAMACNVYTAQEASGFLQGVPKFPVFGIVGRTAPARELVGIVALGALVRDQRDLMELFVNAVFHVNLPRLPFPAFEIPMMDHSSDPVSGGTCKDNCNASPAPEASAQQRLQQCMAAQDDLLAYKARPLTGIWATAPYLHNGSVPTLYDLLLPPDQRPKTFFTGTREFDPVKIGYVTTPSADNDFLFETRAASGEVILGNSNSGHEFGTTLSEDQRRMLLEYLKTL